MTAEQLPGVPHQPLAPHDLPHDPPHDPLLTLAGVSRDGKRLLLVSSSGSEYTVAVDSRLTAALRGDSARLGQLEIEMDSTMRPRDIQARIRAGETPDAVAKAAQTTIDKIMPYASPVLAEREHIAQRAQRSSLRRPGTTARTLGDAVGAHLRGLNVDPAVVTWDAWRREDGRWTLTAKFSVPGRKGTGTFTFDAPGNFVTLEDDHATWLVGDAPVPVPEPVTEVGPTRLSAVPSQGSPDREPTIDLTQAAEAVRGLAYDQPVEAFLDEGPDRDDVALREQAPEATAAAAPDDATDEQQVEDPGPAADEPPGRRSIRKNRGRASVPTWDEIMFGGGKQE
ncbi:MAG: DUF3071 domain-containing protein [Nocardioides sp.]|nr:DUF3071 domain-containing protein [Nocardioides sp.]